MGKVLLKELGSEDALARALTCMDDPNEAQWKGRAAQISQLQRQVKELQSKAAVKEDASSGQGDADSSPVRVRHQHVEPVAEKERAPLLHAADRRREELDRLQEEVEKLR